jgi:aminoglycoside 6'-N-acetyltransferase I
VGEPREHNDEVPRFADYEPTPTNNEPIDSLCVRTATVFDLGGVALVQANSARPAAKTGALEQVILDRDRELLVALEGDTIIGWAKTHHWSYSDGPAGAGHYLGGVTVDPSYRRHGVAGALTAARLEWIWERSADAWYVANSQNLASIDLHRHWGFEEVARRASFHTTHFSGGEGILFRAAAP